MLLAVSMYVSCWWWGFCWFYFYIAFLDVPRIWFTAWQDLCKILCDDLISIDAAFAIFAQRVKKDHPICKTPASQNAEKIHQGHWAWVHPQGFDRTSRVRSTAQLCRFVPKTTSNTIPRTLLGASSSKFASEDAVKGFSPLTSAHSILSSNCLLSFSAFIPRDLSAGSRRLLPRACCLFFFIDKSSTSWSLGFDNFICIHAIAFKG